MRGRVRLCESRSKRRRYKLVVLDRSTACAGMNILSCTWWRWTSSCSYDQILVPDFRKVEAPSVVSGVSLSLHLLMVLLYWSVVVAVSVIPTQIRLNATHNGVPPGVCTLSLLPGWFHFQSEIENTTVDNPLTVVLAQIHNVVPFPLLLSCRETSFLYRQNSPARYSIRPCNEGSGSVRIGIPTTVHPWRDPAF